MGCSKCKKKNLLKEKYDETTSFVSSGVVIFAIVWTIFAVYGVYSLIVKFL